MIFSDSVCSRNEKPRCGLALRHPGRGTMSTDDQPIDTRDDWQAERCSTTNELIHIRINQYIIVGSIFASEDLLLGGFVLWGYTRW